MPNAVIHGRRVATYYCPGVRGTVFRLEESDAGGEITKPFDEIWQHCGQAVAEGRFSL